jgi:hypothetical protein
MISIKQATLFVVSVVVAANAVSGKKYHHSGEKVRRVKGKKGSPKEGEVFVGCEPFYYDATLTMNTELYKQRTAC